MRNFQTLSLILLVLFVLTLLIDLQTDMHNFSIGFVSLCSCAGFIYLGYKSTNSITHINKSNWLKGISSLLFFIIISGVPTIYYLLEPAKVINTGRYIYYSWIFGVFFLAPFIFSLYLSCIVFVRALQKRVK